MVRRSNDAALKVAQILFKKEECASGMEQRGQKGNAALKGVQTKPSAEECALDMGHGEKDAAV